MEYLEIYKNQIKSNLRNAINKNRLDEAKLIVAELERLAPYDVDVYSMKGIIFILEANYAEAESVLNQGLKIDAHDFNVLYNLAYLAEKSGSQCKAKEYYEQSMEVAGDENIRIDIYAKLDKLRKSLRHKGKLNYRKRVLIGCPIRQKPHILKEFLFSLQVLKKDTLDVAYYFIDDNDNPESSKLLSEFEKTAPNVNIHRYESVTPYICNDTTHHWSEKLVWKVADLKNSIIQVALMNAAEYLFLVDSDILLHPATLEHLISRKKEIISQVFWTRWQPNADLLPQVWIYDHYGQYYHNRGENPSPEECTSRMQQFLDMLKQPGTYEVGGLGACTVISRKALEAGVNFSEVRNITFWGEDRHFCIRAASLGLPLYADTHYPAYHIYREKDLEKVAEFKQACGYPIPGQGNE